MRAGTLVLSVGLVASLSCGGEDCSLPTGCLSVASNGGKCTCVAWKPVAVEPAPVKYVVVGVVYAPPGNASSVSYGWLDFAGLISPASDLGARWRAVVRSGGEERVASLGPIAGATSVSPVTEASVAWVEPHDQALGWKSVVDLHSHDKGDAIRLWVNPAAVVTSDAGGGRSVAWSVAPTCPDYFGCYSGGDVMNVTAGVLAGTIPPSAYDQALLDILTAEDRAAILAYDPFLDPANDPSTIPARARFAHAGTFALDGGSAVFPNVQWTPCEGTLTDAAFEVLAESPAIAFGQGDALVLQHSVLSSSATCAVQAPLMTLGSTTPGCAIAGDVYVDRMFGSLLFLPSSVAPECVLQ